MSALDAWGELDQLAGLLDDFSETQPGEYFGVDAMRTSLEQRRAVLIEDLLSHHEPVPEQFDIVLGGAPSTARGVRISLLVDLLDEVQEALAAIGTAIAHGPARTRVSAQMRERVALRVAVALPGSLAVRLVPADASLMRPDFDLFGEHASILEQAADRLVTFFGSLGEDEDEDALGAVSEMGPRGAARVQQLARVIADSEIETRLRWKSPRVAREAVVGVETARRVQDFLATLKESQYSVTYEGRLLGGSLLRRRFELVLPDDQVIRGDVEESVLPLLTDFFGGACRAEIAVAVVSTPGGVTRQSRTLVGLSSLDEER